MKMHWNFREIKITPRDVRLSADYSRRSSGTVDSHPKLAQQTRVYSYEHFLLFVVELPTGRWRSIPVVWAAYFQVGAFREVLSQHTNGVLIGTALPWTLRIAEVNINVGR